VWLGDDTAVLRLDRCGGGRLLLATDAVVAGLDADLALTSLADLGWKALAVNVSDVAAMGGRPLHAVVTVIGAGLAQLRQLYEGIVQAATHFGCPVVGGDLSGGEGLSVSVAVTGWCDGQPVLRSGARPGDRIWVTGALGAANAGLRALQARGTASLAPDEEALVLAHARPRPVVAAGTAAREAGATAMVDVSDGLLSDLGHIADRSGVGFHLADVPVAPGATLEDALAGGDDYVLVFTVSDGTAPGPAFRAHGLGEPVALGYCLPDPTQRLLQGDAVDTRGWQHRLG
jgi:thiamine-monophosphate kinase